MHFCFCDWKHKENVDENETVATAFLDLSKVFDSVSHKILLQNFKNLNFDEKAISMMENYLTEIHRKVTLPTWYLEWIQLY